MKYKILVVYDFAPVTKLRSAIRDHLYAFKNNSDHDVFYLNLGYREKAPWHVAKMQFDLIIFHTYFFTSRWDDLGFERTMRKAAFLKEMNAVKVGMPQDEHFKTDYICRIIDEFNLDVVFSVGPESEWPKFYGNLNNRSVKIRPVLTGYLDLKTLATINTLAGRIHERPIDISYRARRVEPSLGRHGSLKPMIADVFMAQGKDKPLIMDISTKAEDTIVGDDWYRFLLESKYTIGVEGGASIIDRDGSLRSKTIAYMKEHPGATYEEVEGNCFPGMEGTLQYYAISPRHLEACATRTCQVLIEGQYNGILEPNRHYIELKRDFSNVQEVLDLIVQDKVRQQLVDNAHADIVQSGRYTYQSFVSVVLMESLNRPPQTKKGPWDSLICRWNWLQEVIHPTRIKTIRRYRSWKNGMKKKLGAPKK